MADEVFEAFNMPTRKEINTLHKRVQDLRREYDFTVSSDIEELKQQIAALQGKSKTKPGARASAVKAQAKTKKVSKKAASKKAVKPKPSNTKKKPVAQKTDSGKTKKSSVKSPVAKKKRK